MNGSIKFTQPITDFDYILSFDLATHLTGWSLIKVNWNNSKSTRYDLVSSGLVNSYEYKKDDPNADTFYSSMYSNFLSVITYCQTYVQKVHGHMLIVKERLPNQAGKFSTIATLQSLAQTHAIFQLAREISNVNCYDNDGIHSISVRAYFKSLINKKIKDNKEKTTSVDKEDVRSVICDVVCNCKNDTDLNITDSIGVTITLVEKRWNADIDEEIKNVKKAIKSYKKESKINELNEYIKRLVEMKV